MKIIITNDDGYDAFGIQLLIEALHTEHQLIVLAPEHHMSATGSSLTLTKPIKYRKYDNPKCEGYIIDGTPCDCIKVGLNLIDFHPDLCISGINAGSNCGLDLMYSGTLGAAKQAVLAGIPAIAMSNLDYSESYNSMMRLVPHVKRIVSQYVAPNIKCVININFPIGQINGIRDTFAASVLLFEVDAKLQEGMSTYSTYHRTKNIPEVGSDFDVISKGQISISLLKLCDEVESSASYDIKQVYCQ